MMHQQVLPTMSLSLRVSALVLASAGSQPAHAEPAAPEVVGIRFGMAYDDAVAALERHLGKKGSSQEVIYKGSPPVRITFSHSGWTANERLHIAFTGPPSKPTVTEVSRQVDYPTGKEVHYDAVLKALTDKYGPPHFIDVNRSRHVWFFDKIGAELDPLNRANACGSSPVSGGDYSSELSKGPPRSLYDTSRIYRTGCGRALYAGFSNRPGTQVVSRLRMSMTDHPAALAANAKTRELLIQAGERLRAEEANKARSNGAPKI